MKHFVFSFFILLFVSCSTPHEKPAGKGKFSGISILNTPRHGRFFISKENTRHFYNNISTTITNDTTVPIRLQLTLDKSYEQSSRTFNLFFLPEVMIVDSQRKQSYFNQNIQPILDWGIDHNTGINSTIAPGRSITVNTSYLSPPNSDFAPGQLAIISKYHKYFFAGVKDSLYNVKDTANNSGLNLYFGLNFNILTDSTFGFKLIPIGKISYL